MKFKVFNSDNTDNLENNTEDIIRIKSDIILRDKNGNIIEVITPKPEYMEDSLL